MAIEDYSAARVQYPLEDTGHLNSKIQFEIIETIPPDINFKYNVEKWSSLLGGKRKSTENSAASEDAGATTTLGSKNSTSISQARNRATGKKVDLYLPQSNAVSDVFSYDTPSFGAASMAGMTALNNGNDLVGAAGAVVDQALGGIDALLDGFQAGTFGRVAAVRAANLGTGKMANAASLVAKTALHPNMRTKFNNVGIRKFSFTFNLIPRSAEEANAIKEIVKYFRFHAYPEEIPVEVSGTNITFPIAYKYPDMFRIKMFVKSNGTFVRSQHRILDCYCEGITTNYNPNVAVYHQDGEPIQTDLTLNFIEFRALSRGDLDPALGFMTPERAQQESGPF